MEQPSINKIHRNLQDVSLPSTIEDLKNPTEDYIVNLLTTFLSQFCINMSLIDQPLSEQLDAMAYYEDSDVINLINLHAVVARIFDKIFIHDFCLTDITSPGQKRFRKQAQYLSNFVLYTLHTKSKFNDKMEEIQTMSKLLKELKERKAQVSEAINNKLMHKAKQLSMMEKLEAEIRHVQSRTEQFNKKELELEAMKNDIEKENQKAKELYGSVKTTAKKLSKMITEVQSEVVNSPEEYRFRLNEIEEQHKLKVKERSEVQNAIQDKKQLIKQVGEKLNFVKKMTGDFCILADIYKEQQSKKTKLDEVKKETDSFNNIWKESKTKLAKHKDQVDAEKNNLQTYREEDMRPLCNLYNQLLSERKVRKTKLDKDRDCSNEKCLKRNKLHADVEKIEEETVIFINSCQETYNNEIANELELRKVWKEE